MNERFEKFNDEFLKFERIFDIDKLHSRPDICAFLYLSKLLPESDNDVIVGASHDIIWLSTPKNLTDNDIIYLLRCGVHWSTETDCLGMFC